MEGQSVVEPSKLPPLTVVLLEDIAQRLEADTGHWRVELEFRNGNFHVAWRHQLVSRERLRAFDQASGAVPT
jgi:hypothetical protein